MPGAEGQRTFAERTDRGAETASPVWVPTRQGFSPPRGASDRARPVLAPTRRAVERTRLVSAPPREASDGKWDAADPRSEGLSPPRQSSNRRTGAADSKRPASNPRRHVSHRRRHVSYRPGHVSDRRRHDAESPTLLHVSKPQCSPTIRRLFKWSTPRTRRPGAWWSPHSPGASAPRLSKKVAGRVGRRAFPLGNQVPQSPQARSRRAASVGGTDV